MRPLLLLILCLLVLAPTVRAQETLLPNPPLGQVLDRKEWLGENRAVALEERLRRYRSDIGIDVLVVVWDRELPENQTLEELTRKLGKTWAREELWAVVLTAPNSLQRPEICYGGIVADQIDAKSLDHAVAQAIVRGLKDWTEQARIEAVALEIGEEFAYLMQRRTQELAFVRERVADITAVHQKTQKKQTFKYIFSALSLVLALSAALYFWLKLRRRGPYEFPETRWRKRLGGSWSGGSTIAATLPPTHSS